MTLPRYITSAADLRTSPEAKGEGFLTQALAKSGEKAVPYVEKAKALMTALSSGVSIDELLADPTSRDDLVVASGLSNKARKYFTEEQLEERVREVLTTIAGSAGDRWPEEIVYRYLLTRGDSLGGEMRNWIGANAQRQFSSALKGFLPVGRVLETSDTKSGKLRRLDWDARRIYFDAKPRFIGNNVDVILVDTSLADASGNVNLLEEPRAYLAAGELKGGIDPAGADEHWKTARSALERIRARFNELGIVVPRLFFVGAAIEERMSNEIFGYLRNGTLNHAANLTKQEQVEDLAQWLVNL
jgi:hypothetical protein